MLQGPGRHRQLPYHTIATRFPSLRYLLFLAGRQSSLYYVRDRIGSTESAMEQLRKLARNFTYSYRIYFVVVFAQQQNQGAIDAADGLSIVSLHQSR